MLSKFLSKLGYVPVKQLNQLQTKVDNLETIINLKNSTISDRENRIKILESKVQDYVDSNTLITKKQTSLKESLQFKDNLINDLNKDIRKLLRQKKKYKETIKELSEINSKTLLTAKEYQTKAIYLKSYSEAITERLEYIVFGSVLPRVMRNYGIEKYFHPKEPITLKWKETPEGLQVYADQFNQDNH